MLSSNHPHEIRILHNERWLLILPIMQSRRQFLK